MFKALTGKEPTPDDMRAVTDMLRDDNTELTDDAREAPTLTEP